MVLTFNQRIIFGVGLVEVRLDLGPNCFELEKLRHVEPEGEGQDRDDVVPRRPALGVVVERVADREVPESGSKHGADIR